MFSEALKFGTKFGACASAIGFFGPMILSPSSGNGPMLGIFVTGPLGFLAGAIFGAARHSLRKRQGRR